VSRKRELVFAILAGSLSICAFLLIAELSVRMFVPASLWKLAEPLYEVDSELGWVYKRSAHSTGRLGDAAWNTDVQTNNDGVTPGNTLRERTPGLLRVMLFGDSTVIGRAIPDDQRIHRVLQRLLQKRGVEAEVINAAVEGYATDQSLLLMKRLIPLYRPDIVAYGLCENDLDGNLATSSFGMSKPRFLLSRNGGLAYLPANPAHVEFVRNIHRTQSTSTRFAIQRVALYQVLRPYLAPIRGWWMMVTGKADHAAWNAEMYFTGQVGNVSEQLELLAALLKEMRTTTVGAGAKFLFYSHPSMLEVWDPAINRIMQTHGVKPGAYNRYAFESLMKQMASQSGTSYCPMVTHFARNQSRGPFHLLPRDPHCNPEGYRMTAEMLEKCAVH
jgi:lysophospholipase L1-like esterase